jgi:hypothetical protein
LGELVDLVLDPFFGLLGLASAQFLTGFTLDFGIFGDQHGGGDGWVGDSGAVNILVMKVVVL